MPYRFQKAELNDVEQVFPLYVQRIAWMDEKGIHQWNGTGYLEAYPMEYYQKHQQAGNLYVMKNGDDMVGAMVLLDGNDGRWDDRPEPACYIHNLVTKIGAHGAGRKMLAAAEQIARSMGKRFMRLDCAVDNAFLNEYYEAQGYALAGECSEDDVYKGNRREKAL